MKPNIIDVINSLFNQSIEYHFRGQVELSKIESAAKTMGVEFAEEFVHYTQTFGVVNIYNHDDIDIFGVDDDPNYSVLDRTQDFRDAYPDFPMDCYAIESFGLENFVMVQKSDGKIYKYIPKEGLSYFANSLVEYLNFRVEKPFDEILGEFIAKNSND